MRPQLSASNWSYAPTISRERLCKLFSAEGVTHSAGVPTVWLAMIDHVEQTGASLGKLRLVIIGGSSAPSATIRWFRDRGVHVNHLWGMTEMSPVGTVGAPPANWDQMGEDEQVAYMARPGRSMFGVELRVVDDEGRVLPRDGKSAGKLQTRGAAVVKRYFKQEEDCVDAEQWFDTGDMATIHPTAQFKSPTAPRTSSSRAASGSARSRSKMQLSVARAWPKRRRSAFRIRSGTSGRSCSCVRDPGSDLRSDEVHDYLKSRMCQVVASGRDRIRRSASAYG